MKLPDADGFIVAAQKALENHEAVFLHNAEGDIVAVLVTHELHRRCGDALGRPFLNHDHLEPDMAGDVPWL